MNFKSFLANLVSDAHFAFKESILQSEENRKHHWDEKDGKLVPKITNRVINGVETPVEEHTQHDNYSFPMTYMRLETDTHISKDIKGELKTHVKKGLFKKASHVKIVMHFELHDAPEGVHALNDSGNDELKEKI